MSEARHPTPGAGHGVVRLDAVIRGRVQGVGFRWFASRHAAEHGLTGWVRNEADGSVHVVAEGERAVLDGFVRELEAGPRGAWVDRVEVSWGVPSGDLASFGIRAGGHRGD